MKPCPFCGAGTTKVHESTFWTGMSSQILSVTVQHWCEGEGLTSFLQVKGKTKQEAIDKWDTRYE